MSVLVKNWNIPDGCIVCPLSEYYEPPTYIVDDSNKKCESEYNG